MLEFFRKNQKIFFAVLTVMIIISFVFFGTYSAFTQGNTEEKDRQIGVAVDGSALSAREVHDMVRFLVTDSQDTSLMEMGRYPNYFNDGVLRNDLLMTGLGQMLAKEYFEEMKGDISGKIERAKRFRPYKHPQADFISAESLWGQFVPQVNALLQKVRTCSDPAEGLNLLSILYMEQGKFPPYMLRQFLAYQQGQHQWVQRDPNLEMGDHSLFGFHTIEDWFGSTFVELACQFVYNTALYAKQQGHRVSFEEARADLMHNGLEALKAAQGSDVSSDMVGKAFSRHLAMMNLNEKRAVGVWQKVMLFRRLMEEKGSALFLDRLTYENYHAYSSEGREVEVYRFPGEMKLEGVMDVLKLQRYNELTAGAKGLDLPEKTDALAALEKRCPELLQKKYDVEIAGIEKGVIALDVSLRQMWEWQDENWSKICKEFKHVKKDVAKGERIDYLDQMNPEQRAKVDQFTRMEIANAHPEWVEKGLKGKEMELRTIAVPLSGKMNDLAGIKNVKELISHLDSAGKETIEMFTQDGNHFYRIHVRERIGGPELVGFAEAQKSGLTDRILSDHLRKRYVAVREGHPAKFQKKEGAWKPFADVKEEVGRVVYSDLLKKIEAAYVKDGGKLVKGSLKEEGSFYAAHRLKPVLDGVAKKVAKGDESWLSEKAMWKIEKSCEMVKRKEVSGWFHESLFDMADGSISKAVTVASGDVAFFKLVKKVEEDELDIMNDVREGQKLLANDAKRDFCLTLLEKYREANCIVIENHERSHT